MSGTETGEFWRDVARKLAERDALQAEVERLMKGLVYASDRIKALSAERDALADQVRTTEVAYFELQAERDEEHGWAVIATERAQRVEAERDEAIALLREVTVTDTGQGAAIDAFLARHPDPNQGATP